MKLDNLAKIFLKDRLSYGPCLVSDLIEEAKELGINQRTLQRTRKRLGFLTIKGFNSKWWWLDPEVKMTDDLKKAWLEKNSHISNKLEEIYDKESLKFERDKEDTSTQANLENHGIYYYGSQNQENMKQIRKETRDDQRERALHRKAVRKYFK